MGEPTGLSAAEANSCCATPDPSTKVNHLNYSLSNRNNYTFFFLPGFYIPANNV